jgi:hypothetical protein
VKHLATASSGLTSADSMAAESKAKNASSDGMPHAVRISSEIAMVPLVGSARGDAVIGCGAAIPGFDGALATGGLVVAHALVKRRSGAIARATADESTAHEIVFMVLTSEKSG